MKVQEIIKLCQNQGWYRIKTRGGHLQYKHPLLPGKIAIPGHFSSELKRGTLHNITKKLSVYSSQ